LPSPLDGTQIFKDQPIGGPGTELKKLLTELGTNLALNCGCNSYAAQMDQWGVDGCRERRAEVIAHLTNQWKNLGWWDKVRLGTRALVKGYASPSDPVGYLVDEAIRRAEKETP
jgi:hypothetical protein